VVDCSCHKVVNEGVVQLSSGRLFLSQGGQ